MNLNAAMLSTMTPDQILAFIAKQQSEADARVKVAEAEAAKAKSKSKAKDFDPNTCEIYVKPGGKTINIKLGKGVGKYGVLTFFPEGLLRLEKLLATGRLQAYIDENRATLLEMHAAYLAEGDKAPTEPAEEPAAA